MERPDFTQRDTIRANFGADLIAGQGVEIGAGAFPQMLPSGATASHYDIRDAAELRVLFGTETIPVRPISELPSDFPSGADFLIAHNVLEHCPNPIGELIRWNACVREGGVVLLSLPHYLYCPDARRRLPPVSHLIEDYFNVTDGSDFVSRDHGASCTLGWWQDFCSYHETTSIERFSQLALDNLTGDGPDFHWHAFDSNLTIQTAVSAAMLSGTRIELMRCWRPELGQTFGDILIAYRTVGRSEPGGAVLTLARLHTQRGEILDQAVDLIGREVQAFADRQESIYPKLRIFPLIRPFIREGAYCAVTRMPAEFLAFLKQQTTQMKVTVRENGQTLGPADSLHQFIRDQGGGAFSVWHGNVYFSSSDRTDCNTNGRQYEIVATADDGAP